MQGQNSHQDLLQQLNKLEFILKAVPLNMQFVKGYIFGHLPIYLKLSASQLKQFIDVLEQLFLFSQSKIIEQRNFLEIMVVLSFRLFKQAQYHRNGFKIVLEQISKIVSQLSMNHWYLRQKYFLRKASEYKISQLKKNAQYERVIFTYNNPSQNKQSSQIPLIPNPRIFIQEKKKQPIKKQEQQQLIKKQEQQQPIKKQEQQQHIKKQEQQQPIKKQKMQLQHEKVNLGIQCPICIVQIFHSDVSVLSCGHILHKNCLQQYLKEVITNKKLPVKCPFAQCEVNMDTRDIQQYLSKPMLDKYYEFSFQNFVQKNHKGVSWCPTAGCPSVFQFDQQLPNYRCPNCKKNYCLKCKCQMHTGISCELYKNMNGLSEEDKQFVDFARGLNFKQCPSCKFWVQKNQGCNHMTCRCQYQFCYVCGAQYGTCDCQQDQQDYDGQQDYEDQQDYYNNEDA